MNIKVASAKTGLTKKAIKYYKNEGLVYPSKNNENNYREYTDEDIVKLNLIGDSDTIQKSVRGIVSFAKSITENEETRKKFGEILSKTKTMLNSIGVTNNIFDDYLEILNENYKKIREKSKEMKREIDSAMKNEIGLSWEEFLQSLES